MPLSGGVVVGDADADVLVGISGVVMSGVVLAAAGVSTGTAVVSGATTLVVLWTTLAEVAFAVAVAVRVETGDFAVEVAGADSVTRGPGRL